jgi:hypothetical protein
LPGLCWRQSTQGFSARHGFERIEIGDLVQTYAQSVFEDARRKAEKYGACGTTVKAFKTRR